MAISPVWPHRIEQIMNAEQEVSDQVGTSPDAVADMLDKVLAVGSAERTGDLLAA